MGRAASGIVALCILLLSCAALAEEKSAGGQTPSQAGQVERTRGQFQNLSPEERAKLREKWATMSGEERTQARARMREQLSAHRPNPGTVREQSTAEQIAALKQEHQAIMTDLQNIRQVAAREKAAETAQALDSLMARRRQEYQQRLQQMEQRLRRFQSVQKDAGRSILKTDPNQPAATQRRLKAAQKRSAK